MRLPKISESGREPGSNFRELLLSTNVLLLPIKILWKVTEKRFEQRNNYGSESTKTLSWQLSASSLGQQSLWVGSSVEELTCCCAFGPVLCGRSDQSSDGGSDSPL